MSSRVAFTPVSQNCFHDLDAGRTKAAQQQKQGGKIGAKDETQAKGKGKGKGKAKDRKGHRQQHKARKSRTAVTPARAKLFLNTRVTTSTLSPTSQPSHTLYAVTVGATLDALHPNRVRVEFHARYSEFEALNAALTARFPKLGALSGTVSFPGKMWLWNDAPGAVEQRASDLHAWLAYVAKNNDKEMREAPELLSFLRMSFDAAAGSLSRVPAPPATPQCPAADSSSTGSDVAAVATAGVRDSADEEDVGRTPAAMSPCVAPEGHDANKASTPFYQRTTRYLGALFDHTTATAESTPAGTVEASGATATATESDADSPAAKLLKEAINAAAAASRGTTIAPSPHDIEVQTRHAVAAAVAREQAESAAALESEKQRHELALGAAVQEAERREQGAARAALHKAEAAHSEQLSKLRKELKQLQERREVERAAVRENMVKLTAAEEQLRAAEARGAEQQSLVRRERRAMQEKAVALKRVARAQARATEARLDVSVKRAETLEAELKRCRQTASAAGDVRTSARPSWAPPLALCATGGGGSCEGDYTMALALGCEPDGGLTHIVLHPLDVMPFAHELVEAPCDRQPELFPVGFEFA